MLMHAATVTFSSFPSQLKYRELAINRRVVHDGTGLMKTVVAVIHLVRCKLLQLAKCRISTSIQWMTQIQTALGYMHKANAFSVGTTWSDVINSPLSFLRAELKITHINARID